MTGGADKVSDKALGEFLSEAQEIVESLNRDILKLDDLTKRGKKNPELINNIFRSAHSLKGLSGMFGVKKMSDFAHDMENLLDAMRMGKVPLSIEMIDVLFDSVELFIQLIAEASDGPKVPKRNVNKLTSQINKLAKQSEAGKSDNPLTAIDIDPGIINVLTEYEEYRLIDNIRQSTNLYKVHASFDLMDFDENLASLSSELKTFGEVITTLPASESSNEQGIDFDLIISSDLGLSEVKERIENKQVIVFSILRKDPIAKSEAATVTTEPSRTEPSDEPIDYPGDLPDEDIDGGDDGGDDGPPSDEAASLRSVSQTVRVDIKRLDSLMNIVGELVLVRTAIQSISDQLKADQGFTGLAIDLLKESRNFERKLDDLQAGIMEVRMVPLGQNFEKMSRMVRKLSRGAGKEIQLEISGSETELDKLIVEDLADPLMHILRNSIDHGIEPSAERKRKGKPEVGVIKIHAYQKGNHVVIEISDDGRGLDIAKIKTAAISNNLIPKDHLEDMTQRDLLNLLFLPGFSTSEEVGELSGRGVGLDVVKTNIARLSGMIDVHTETGQGTRFTITLPITLAIIRALIIRVNEHIYAVPLNSVLEIITVKRDRVRTIERREVIELRGTTLPLLRLSELFEIGSSVAGETDSMYIVVVGLAQNRLGIVVDGVIGQQDIVIKSLGKSLSKISGIVGATNLASQQTILVLDVGALIEEALFRE